MTIASPGTLIAFAGDHCISEGTRHDVARTIWEFLGRWPEQPVLIFDAATSQPVEIDVRGDLADVLARLAPLNAPEPDAPTPRGPGRPKLGVVAREVTLLPRHWDWLARQRGGASVALRRLVDEARRADADPDRIRGAQDAAYRFMAAMAGNRPHYEDALRALFAGDAARFETLTDAWPADICDHARRLATPAFAQPVPVAAAS